MSQFVAEAFFLCSHTQSTLQNANDWNANQSYAIGGGNPLPFLRPLVTVLHVHLTSLDSPEIGAGTILGPSGPSTSSSTGTTSSSSSTSPAAHIHSNSSNTGAIAGGVVGGIGAISILIAALFFGRRFYRQRGWGRQPTPPTPSAIDERPSGFNSLMDQVPRSMSGPGTIASSLPDMASIQRPYVCVFVAPASLLCVHVFCLYCNAQDPDDPTTFPGYQGPGYQGPSPPPMYNPYSQIGHESPSTSSGKNTYAVAPAARNSQGTGLGYSGLPEVAP